MHYTGSACVLVLMPASNSGSALRHVWGAIGTGASRRGANFLRGSLGESAGDGGDCIGDEGRKSLVGNERALRASPPDERALRASPSRTVLEAH